MKHKGRSQGYVERQEVINRNYNSELNNTEKDKLIDDILCEKDK